MIIKPKGCHDIYGYEAKRWQYVSKVIDSLMEKYNYNFIRTPIFESSEVFHRGVGETTDIVSKETYDFKDRGDRSMTLRPEGTAGIVRSFVENKMYGDATQPIKLYYNGTMYRYERPQSGRDRELTQFGVEVLGSDDPIIDAEVISIPVNLFKLLGLKEVKVKINTLGDIESRNMYRDALVEHFSKYINELCPDCQERYKKNPMRILDCKNKNCGEITKNAPIILDYMCEECDTHFTEVKKYLDALNIPYTVDPGIVRGLDYYTKTIFEILNDDFTVCGGGRYDRLIEQLGGPEMPAVGFGLGIERLLLTLQNEGIEIPNEGLYDLYIGARGEDGKLASFKLANALRTRGIKTEINHMGRSLKAEMKYANKIGAKFTVVLGDDELQTGNAKLKRMSDGEQFEVNLNNIEEIVAILNS